MQTLSDKSHHEAATLIGQEMARPRLGLPSSLLRADVPQTLVSDASKVALEIRHGNETMFAVTLV